MAELSYTTTATAWGGRIGRVATSDGRLDYQLSMPEGMGGEGGEGTNPEQLFACGYAACFHNALRSVARRARVDVTDSAVSVTVTISGNAADGVRLSITIEAEMPGVDSDTAELVLAAAHDRCPYSRALRGNHDLTVVLVPSVS
jgi:Ohr subfamily peroxiredoxin